jgi:hypothetical protein
MERKHTIVLVQPTNNPSTRTYTYYENVSAAMDGICRMFEKKLKELNPSINSITYDISDLYRYIDTFPDISTLIQDKSPTSYARFDKEWIKKKIYNHLRRQAA